MFRLRGSAGARPELAAMSMTADLRLENLARANRIRSYRSEVKRNVAAGAPVCPMIQHPPPELNTMRVAALIGAVPKWGPTKVRVFLRRLQIPGDKTVAGLSERQRLLVVAALTEAGLC